MNQPQRIRIVESGWQNFTGNLAGVDFTAGLSNHPTIPQQASHLGSIIRIESVDDNAQVGAGQEQIDLKSTSAPDVTTKPASEIKPAEVENEAPTVDPNEITREHLTKVADDSGIHGLREIAEKFGVKGRGIGELIEEILVAQAKKKAEAQ